ncbi:unknown [Clostridium sp. CAG:411]|jgi:hypothetical protein|nr:unknown [Clostridium sp. CAG:411]
MRKNIKKVMGMIGCSLIAVGVTSPCIHASCTVYGYLNTSAHIVPIVKDTAEAHTAVTSGGSAVSKIKNKTTVYAYNSKGEYTTDSATASGAGAMEGWGGQVKATMRAMVKAKGSHQGKNGTVSNYVKTTTSWKK